MRLKITLSCLLLILAISAQAERYTTGPFTVSFKVEPTIEFTETVTDTDETLEGINFTTYQLVGRYPHDKKSISIYIKEYSDPSGVEPLADEFERPTGKRISRKIDGHEGRLLDTYGEGYLASWHIDNCTEARVVAASSYWDCVRQLLRTIHIERT